MNASPTPSPIFGSQRYHPGLILALPYLLLLTASLVSWPWRALDGPGTVGGISPPAAVLLMLAAAGGFYATRRRLPLGLFTWPPAGLGAVAILAIGFAARESDLAAAPAALLAFVVVYGFVLLISVALAKHSTHYAIAFGAFFLMAQAARIPVFEAEAGVAIAGAPLFTMAAALRAVLEMGALLWIAYGLLFNAAGPAVRSSVLLWALVMSHGLLSGWQEPLLRDEALTVGSFGEAAVQWMVSSSVLLGIVTVASRFRYRLAQESTAQAAQRPEAEIPTEPGDEETEGTATAAPPPSRREAEAGARPRRSRRGFRSRRRRQ